MVNVVAVNGSTRQENGRTAMILAPFLKGLEVSGAEIHLFYASKLKIRPCNCNQMYCWRKSPGECIYKDDMQHVYPLLKQAALLVLATPVYIPLPGDMQNFINRLVPLLDPVIEYRNGRTRARFREDVHIEKICLVASGSWWEPENFDTVIRIAEELAEGASVSFVGPIIRPHSQYMYKNNQLTEDGQYVLQAIERAGEELIRAGEIQQETLDAIKRPLISKERFFNR